MKSDRPLDAAMRICQIFMDAGEGKLKRPINPDTFLTDAFAVSKAYLELSVATGRTHMAPAIEVKKTEEP